MTADKPGPGLPTIDAMFALAREAHQGGRLAKAEHGYRRVLEVCPEHADAISLLGVLASQIGRFDDAVSLLKQAIQIDARRPEYHTNLGQVWQRAGDPLRATRCFERALQLTPDDFRIYMNLGGVQRESGDLQTAVLSYQRAVALEPSNPAAHYGLGSAHKALGRLGDAINSLRRGLRLNPRALKIRSSLAAYLLEAGEPQAALAECDECLRVDPRYTVAVAFKSVALGALGRGRELRELFDFDRLICASLIAVPHGYADVREFNADLVEQIKSHPALIDDTSNLATRFGKQTGELQVQGQAHLQVLKQVLNDAVSDFLRSRPHDATHPFLGQAPVQWQLSIWAVTLESQGHQLSHMHGDGWVSGVYYLQLPDCVASGGAEQAGWIEFGYPPDEFAAPHTPVTRRIQPQEGKLLLFPSYLYHRTIPFESQQPRISVAFDAIPRWTQPDPPQAR